MTKKEYPFDTTSDFPSQLRGSSIVPNPITGISDGEYEEIRVTRNGFQAGIHKNVVLQKDEKGRFWISPFTGKRVECPWTDEELMQTRKEIEK